MRRPVRIAAPIAVFILILFFFLAHPHIGGVLPTIPLSHREAINQKHTFISHGDDGLFDPPEASIQHNAIRGDNVAWTMDGSTTWHSVSRPPNRPECWSYDDRFSAYKLPSAAMQTIISTNNQRTKNSTRAIVLRLGPKHAWGPQFTYHARALVMEAGYLAGYSVFILTHLDGNTASPAPRRSGSVARPGTQRPAADTLEHNHVPIQMFMSRNPQYEFAYTVESDVRLVGRWDVFLGDVDREYAVHRARRDADQNMPAVPDGGESAALVLGVAGRELR
ncbi:hypothetical protein DRE_03720 [Drechslerella stenobrocha 248]|uniref:Uncharacterized protein n=1 Tax=Drechslerella stenobrocha 248 TaxID=1043628 RepID=W7I454_9PEZI|nr:hypothetical protein DRE_03720 [Drechslerella stenobrocha 248]